MNNSHGIGPTPGQVFDAIEKIIDRLTERRDRTDYMPEQVRLIIAIVRLRVAADIVATAFEDLIPFDAD